jgi:hypothetical protein
MTAPNWSRGIDTRAILRQLAQPLSAILSNAQAAKRLVAADSPDLIEVRAALADIVSQSKQAAKIYRRLEEHLLGMEGDSGK